MGKFNLTSVSGKISDEQAGALESVAGADAPVDPLDLLLGNWAGTGFNQIWRPANKNTSGGNPNPINQDRFLELNETIETLDFSEISKEIPNRGFDQQVDINLRGIDYLQKISDANVKDNTGQLAGIHFEPGMWLNIPPTDNDPVVSVNTLARLATIPHGTSLVAQGTFSTTDGPPTIPTVDITPFVIGRPNQKITFPESDLQTTTKFRTSPGDIPNVTQEMVDNPNSFLQAGLAGKNIISTTTITVSTLVQNPLPSGGGTNNIAFLQGVGGKPNARAVQVDSTFWIETIQDAAGKTSLQLQYSQTVLLDFAGLSWPHLSVATLIQK